MSDKPILLMADDEPSMGEFAQLALGKDYQIIKCRSGNEVVSAVGGLAESSRKVDVALLDYNLPWGSEMDSALDTEGLITFLQKREARVGLITAWVTRDARDLGVRLGVPIFDKLRFSADGREGLRRIVSVVRESFDKRMVEGE